MFIGISILYKITYIDINIINNRHTHLDNCECFDNIYRNIDMK